MLIVNEGKSTRNNVIIESADRSELTEPEARTLALTHAKKLGAGNCGLGGYPVLAPIDGEGNLIPVEQVMQSIPAAWQGDFKITESLG